METKPKYWYNQSAVIPFRYLGDSIEILIISSAKGRKWIFPKGIIEPELTPKESAIKETLEEAGVEGIISNQKLSKYSYKKWGGKCKVRVYTMKVNLVHDSWEENYRDRKWIKLNNVSDYIKDKKLIRIVNVFINKVI